MPKKKTVKRKEPKWPIRDHAATNRSLALILYYLVNEITHGELEKDWPDSDPNLIGHMLLRKIRRMQLDGTLIDD